MPCVLLFLLLRVAWLPASEEEKKKAAAAEAAAAEARIAAKKAALAAKKEREEKEEAERKAADAAEEEARQKARRDAEEAKRLAQPELTGALLSAAGAAEDEAAKARSAAAAKAAADALAAARAPQPEDEVKAASYRRFGRVVNAYITGAQLEEVTTMERIKEVTGPAETSPVYGELAKLDEEMKELEERRAKAAADGNKALVLKLDKSKMMKEDKLLKMLQTWVEAEGTEQQKTQVATIVQEVREKKEEKAKAAAEGKAAGEDVDGMDEAERARWKRIRAEQDEEAKEDAGFLDQAVLDGISMLDFNEPVPKPEQLEKLSREIQEFTRNKMVRITKELGPVRAIAKQQVRSRSGRGGGGGGGTAEGDWRGRDGKDGTGRTGRDGGVGRRLSGLGV